MGLSHNRVASQRVYVQIGEAAVVATLALPAYVAVVQPSLSFDGERFCSVNVPTSVLARYGLLMLAFIAPRATSSAPCTRARCTAR